MATDNRKYRDMHVWQRYYEFFPEWNRISEDST